MNLVQSFVFFLFPFVQAASMERQIIESINLYRNALFILDPYPATQFAQVVRIQNRILLKLFKETCNRYDLLLLQQIPKRLFPKYNLGEKRMDYLPNDILEYFSLKATDGMCASTFLASVPWEQRFAVQMTIFQWNHLIKALSECSEELRLFIQAIPDTRKQTDVMGDRLYAAQVILMYLFHINFTEERDVVVLYHLLEYLRHFMCVQWREAHARGYFVRAKDTWSTFVIQVNFRNFMLI